MDCIFCKIIKDQIPSHKIWEDRFVLAFLDVAPVNPGHVLVMTKEHYGSLEDVDDLMLGYLMVAVKKIGGAMKKTLGVKGYNVHVNNGAVAGQAISHFHIHLIPRTTGDGLEHWVGKTYKRGEAEKIVAKFKVSLK